MSLREMKSIWPREWAQARDGRKDRNTISSGQKTMEMFPLIPTGSESAAATNFPPKWTSICLKESCKCWNLLQNKPVLYYSAPWFPAFLPLNSLVSHFWASGFSSEKCIHFQSQRFLRNRQSEVTHLCSQISLCFAGNLCLHVHQKIGGSLCRGEEIKPSILYRLPLKCRYLGKSWAKLVFTTNFWFVASLKTEEVLPSLRQESLKIFLFPSFIKSKWKLAKWTSPFSSKAAFYGKRITLLPMIPFTTFKGI